MVGWRVRRIGGLAAACVLAVSATACTSQEPAPAPSPSPTAAASAAPEVDNGDRIAVIVPPSSVVAAAEAGALVRAARELAASAPSGVADIRVVEAASPDFVRDLADLAVDDGYDVVCIVGTGSADLALELARSRRDVRVCTTDGRVAGGPVNLVAVALDPAVLVQVGAIAIGTAPAPVGLLLSPQLGDTEALTATFTASVAPPTQPPAPPAPGPDGSPAPAPSPTQEEAAASPAPAPSPPGPTSQQPPFVTASPGPAATAQVTAGEELAAQRPSRALVLATPGGVGAATATAANGAALVSVTDWVVDQEGAPPANLLVGLTVDWSALLTGAIAAARDPEAAQVDLRGTEVLGAIAGRAEEAATATERTVAFLEQDDG